MPNNFFRFKEFIIHQDKCAMKVCTDACLFGAWTANFIQQYSFKNILDIGSGTGLLSLMVVQKNKTSKIDAVEIDENAAVQAASNFQESEWKENLKVFNISVQNFHPDKKYDFIISNPPFFENYLQSENENRNKALHDVSLSLKELLANIHRLIIAEGFFSVLLPFHRTEYFEKIAAAEGFFLNEKILVKQTEKHAYFRSMLLFSKKAERLTISETNIKEKSKQYSKQFEELLRDYYLNL